MQAKASFLLRNIGNVYFILSGTPEDFLIPSNILTTNASGAYLWEQLQKPISMQDLTASLCSHYEIDVTTASEDIENFLNGLRKIGALEEDIVSES